MADIRLTEANDVYLQTESQKNDWNNVFGLAGNDSFKLYQGVVIGGPGNDQIEKLSIANEPWHSVGAAYWDSPTGVRVDLQEGWAEDGFGGRDRLIGVDQVHGNGRDDWFRGNASDNFFWGNGGNDTLIGGDGVDGTTTPWFSPGPNQPFRVSRFSDLDIQVSADGRQAVIRPVSGTGFSLTLIDMEYFQVQADSGPSPSYQLADFITQHTLAEQTIAAGDTLRWNAGQALGTPTSLSFSFVGSAPTSGVSATGFRPFSVFEKQVVRDILANTAALTGLSFTEVIDTGTGGGQIRFGVNQQAATKGVSWLPGTPNAGSLAGDVWMDVESMVDLTPGSAGYAALLHEIGHALGLRHPRNVDTTDAWSVQMRAQDDSMALSAMSQVAPADGLYRADWGPLDVIALRYLYGSRSVGMGDTTYRLGSAQASAKTTLVDDGGIDTLDASAYATGVRLSLVPGASSSVGFTTAGLAGTDNLGSPVTTLFENAIGTAMDDVLIGNDLSNHLTGRAGNDWIDGGNGLDFAHYDGRRADYIISTAYGESLVEARDGTSGFDTVQGVERLIFSDKAVALDVDGTGGKAYRLYKAAFDRTPDAGGLGFWIDAIDKGFSLVAAAGNFIASAEFVTLYGANPSNERFTELLYQNVLDRAPDAGGLKFWNDALNSGFTRAQALAQFSESSENQANVIGVIVNGFDYLPVAG